MTIYNEPILYLDETLTKRVELYKVFSKTDPLATDMFKGHVTLMIPDYGAVPFDFPIPATSIEEAFEKFVQAQKDHADKINSEAEASQKDIIQMKDHKEIIT